MIITNTLNKENLKSTLENFSDKSDEIKMAVAFFSETKLLKNWITNGKKFEIIVSLRPPTNYYSLKEIFSNKNIEIRFLGNEFHSKIYLFYKNNELIHGVLGSSNFSNGGLETNIETNILIDDRKLLNELEKSFKFIKDRSRLLEPPDLEKFKESFEKFRVLQQQIEDNNNKFENKLIKSKEKTDNKIKITKIAKDYYHFWKIVNDVKLLVEDISEKEYPKFPLYLTIDHFWHWIKVIWDQNESKKMQSEEEYRIKMIPILFKRYCDWDKNSDNFTAEMFKRSKKISKILSLTNLETASKENILEVYKSLHSTSMPIQRFGADKEFIENNELQKIKESFKYLLYSNEDIATRIHNLLKNDKYRLIRFGDSCTQELIGWSFPEKYPIRNGKADQAVRIIGYEF